MGITDLFSGLHRRLSPAVPCVAKPAPEPLDPALAAALAHARGHNWGRAQRALEEMVRRGDAEAPPYLAEVRAVRRCLRQLAKWPRDAGLHWELGLLYFGLEMGDDALWEWQQAAELEPGRAQAHYGLALEHLFRGEVAAARRAHARAHALDPSLPEFVDLLRALERDVEVTAAG